MANLSYTTPISLTSQFLFCGLPLRLDSYRGCGFQCAFCFARQRGGNTPEAVVVPARPESIRRTFERAFRSDEHSLGVVGQFLRRRAPIHFGGMSDRSSPSKQDTESRKLLWVFSENTIIPQSSVLEEV